MGMLIRVKGLSRDLLIMNVIPYFFSFRSTKDFRKGTDFLFLGCRQDFLYLFGQFFF